MPDATDPGATIPLSRPQNPAPPGGAANPDAPLDYLFGPEIARGGMGSILQAEDCKLPRTVAVKIISSRSEAGEHHGRRVRRGAGDGLGTGEEPGRGCGKE